ncbi:MAG: sulfate adenylyltransferase [Candidatus Hodarchaeota archaeon]
MIPPHGGRLINRILTDSEVNKILDQISEFPSLFIDNQCVKVIKNISFGVFSPLEGFMGNNDLTNVLESNRLENDLPWTIPIVLDVEEKDIQNLKVGDQVILLNNYENENIPVAILSIEEIYTYDKKNFAQKVYSTLDPSHPGVKKVNIMKNYLLGGKINLLKEKPSPFPKYTLKPKETRILFKTKGWRSIVGFQTRNPPHLGHEYVQKTALTFVDGIFINPVIGQKKTSDFTDEVIMKAYEVLLKYYYLKENAVLSIFETEMRYAGPKEAIYHAIARKNFGCTHIIIGRDHAGVGNFYQPYAAHKIFDDFPDLGINPLFLKSFYKCTKCGTVVNERICPHDEQYHINFSGTKIRELLQEGKRPSTDLMRPEVVDIILESSQPFVE